MGFDHCPLFLEKGTILEWPISKKAPIRDCPRCGCRKGVYCMNETRMVKKAACGFKIGKDVHSWTKGTEVKIPRCCMM